VKKFKWKPPADVPQLPYRPHAGEGSQYLRDFILGVNDGLISTFLLVVAVVGGGAGTLQALLTGISTGVAGAVAMGVGEYIATKSQLQVNEGEMRLEVEHFKYHRDVELQQLRQFFESVKLSGPLLEAVVAEVGRSDDSLMKMMMAFEFGVHADELERNPIKAMLMSGRLFLLGALPTVVPFFATTLSPTTALAIAAALVGLALFVVGAYKTRTTKSNWLYDGLENVVLGAIATGIAYAVGIAFDKASGGQVTE
jgi:VIT1/CCC1 family predicted Fe2+/Mn2+ transporter